MNLNVQHPGSILRRPAIYWGSLGSLICIGIWTCIIFESLLPAAGILLILSSIALLAKPKWSYYGIALAIPLSTELYLPGNLGTDFPSEPLMWISFGIAGLLLFSRLGKMDMRPLMHPASLILMAIFFWTTITTLLSEHTLISIKYTLAKTWYLGLFFFLPLYLFRKEKHFRQWILLLVGSVTLTMMVILLRQAMQGFSFGNVNKLLDPFYRNHVAYACMLGVTFPYVIYLRNKSNTRSLKIFMAGLATIVLTGIVFSYTRAAMIATLIAGIWILVMRFKLTKYAILASIIGGVGISVYFIKDSRYLAYAPDYYRTIAHKNFDDLISATYKLEDISTMERVYRWVAGYHMMTEKPVLGFGPNTFYETYHTYTVKSFQTYVSDNPEKSGIHNYYFMLLVEQGWPGLLLWVVWICYLLILAEKLWHYTRKTSEAYLVQAATMCMVFVLMVSLMNDLIETDKVGPLFYISAAMITVMAIRNKLI